MRKVPPRLQAHLDGGILTVCRLLKFTLVDGRIVGLTTLDIDIMYQGVRYRSLTGFDPSIIATDASVKVSNGEVNALLAREYMPGLTEREILAGALDDAVWECYLINWMDVTMGHAILDIGNVGQVTVSDGVVYSPELLSFAMMLRKNIGGVWSRSCRAIYGTPADSQTGCGVDVTPLWQPGTVAAVDDEDAHRVFRADGLVGDLFPGRVRWISGNNASATRLYKVEGFSEASGTVALFEGTPFPIYPTDEFEIRPDCNKSPSDCKKNNNFINYKGENMIPVGDGLESMVPGAQVFGGLNGSTIVD